ncbi:hypothetical protein F5877DRAFT_72965 [Lentinula edodes]|nr:hypothetical protein F5877DRAFT_72965 [Lentinula edodes]
MWGRCQRNSAQKKYICTCELGGGQDTTEAGPSSVEGSATPTQVTDVDMEDGNDSDGSEEENMDGKLIRIINPTQPEQGSRTAARIPDQFASHTIVLAAWTVSQNEASPVTFLLPEQDVDLSPLFRFSSWLSWVVLTALPGPATSVAPVYVHSLYMVVEVF